MAVVAVIEDVAAAGGGIDEEDERLPGRLTIEAEDWSVSLLEGLRASFRSWAARS